MTQGHQLQVSLFHLISGSVFASPCGGSLELASEIFHDFFAYGICGEEPGSALNPALVTWAKFQKQQSHERGAVEEEFGIQGE